MGTVLVSAECADDGKREFEDVGTITGYENAYARRITALDIEAYADGRRIVVEVGFDSKNIGASIRITAPEQAAQEIRARIVDVLGGTKPWYSFVYALSRWDMAEGLVLSLPAIGIALFIGSYVWEDFLSESSTFIHILVLIAWTLWGMLGLKWLRHRLFPPCYFAIGQGEERYQTLKYIHSVLLTVLIALVAGAIYA